MHIKISHILPIFCITGGKYNSDRQICKDITVNDAPAFWLQATAIKIPLSKSKDHQLCTFIHTHYAEKQPQVKCKNDLVFSCSPFQKGVQYKTYGCQKTWNCSAAYFSWKRLLSIPRSTVTCSFSQHFVLLFHFTTLGTHWTSLSRVQPLTCTLCTMTKSTFCNATNHGDSEALQKCLILSAKNQPFCKPK